MEEMIAKYLIEGTAVTFLGGISFFIIYRLNGTLAELTQAIKSSNNEDMKADVKDIKNIVTEIKLRGELNAKSQH